MVFIDIFTDFMCGIRTKSRGLQEIYRRTSFEYWGYLNREIFTIAENDQFPTKESVLLMTAGDGNFWTFEQPISYYGFVTKAIGWKNIGMCLAGGCKSDLKIKIVDERFLHQAYELGASI